MKWGTCEGVARRTSHVAGLTFHVGWRMTEATVRSGAPQGAPPPALEARVAYLLRLADDNLVLAQRLAEWTSLAPELEEDIALTNIGLDHLGVARALYRHAGAVEGRGRSEDDLAFLRSEREYLNLLLVEQPNGDFAHTMARQLMVDAFQVGLWDALASSSDEVLAGIAAKALKEARYHLRHSSAWVIRLGDGTEESHRRMQRAVDDLWRFTGELFASDEVEAALTPAGMAVDPASLRPGWEERVDAVLEEATLSRTADPYQRMGGRTGFHTEHLGHLLGDLQWMQRSYPGLSW
jgi:ring-1,2-phenylacetyl-CoA epoxidase subunit PaaC